MICSVSWSYIRPHPVSVVLHRRSWFVLLSLGGWALFFSSSRRSTRVFLLSVSWVRFDTGTPFAANQGLQRAVEEPALVAGQRTAAKPRVKSNPLLSGIGIGLVFNGFSIG